MLTARQSCRRTKFVPHMTSHVTLCMSHVTHMNKSWHTHGWVMSHIWSIMSHTREWFISHLWKSESVMSHTCDWFISRLWTSHVTHEWVTDANCMTITSKDQVRAAYEWVMSHIFTSHVTHMNESCLTCEGVTDANGKARCIWMRHVTHMCESRHAWIVMPHTWMSDRC